MKPAFILTALIAGAMTASAALPPQYQRQRELTQIIESNEVHEALNGVPIDSVSYEGDDLYKVTAGHCSVLVEIKDAKRKQPSGWAGPRQFSLSVGEATCLDGQAEDLR